jgi:NTE family protein
LIGHAGWRRIRSIRRNMLIAAGALLFAFLILIPVASWITFLFGIGVAVLVLAAGSFLANHWARGLASLETMKTALNAALAAKLGLPPNDPVRFANLPIPLRIVSTDIDRRGLKVFGVDRNECTPVAEAVAASACIPFVFQPRLIDGRRYWDGGLVSNLPVWVFDEERTLDPYAITIALEIPDSPAEVALKEGPIYMLSCLLRAAIFGGGELNKRASGTLISVPLPAANIDTLAFDMTKAEVGKHVGDGRKAVDATVGHRLVALPRAYTDACKRVHEEFRRVAELVSTRSGRAVPEGRIRVNVAQPEGQSKQLLRIVYGYDILDDSDYGLTLPVEETIGGLAFRTGVAQVFSTPFPTGVSMDGTRNRQRRRLVWEGMKWCLAVPIYAIDAGTDERPRMIMNVDSDIPLEYFGFQQMNETELSEFIDTVSQLLVPAVKLQLDFEEQG